MNPLIQFKTTIRALPIAFVLTCLAPAPIAQAVSPAPDGGYPNFTTAEGTNALKNLTTGIANTAVGWLSLETNSTGQFNTAVGAGTLALNTADGNTATGAGALLSNTTGVNNTANGAFALFGNTIGGDNTAIGEVALFGNTTGTFNSAFGQGALYSNAIGSNNAGSGAGALFSNTTGTQNTADGAFALFSNTTGNTNTASGFAALSGNTTGSSNIALGFNAGTGITLADYVIAIGTAGADVSNSCFIGQIRGVTTQNANAIPVLIDSAGQLGTMSSSRRFKKEIQPMDKASEAILALKPVTFRYKVHKDTTPQFGLIAEEVAAVNPDLVVYDKNGEIYTVRYDAVNAMLLNEFLKEHRRVQELEATVAQQRKDSEATAVRQQKQIDALTAGLQKVSAQLEASKATPQVVNNP